MSRYYLHLRDGSSELLDAEGAEFADMAALKTVVTASARELMCEGIRDGVLDLRLRIDAENDRGAVLYTLPFSQAALILKHDEQPAAADQGQRVKTDEAAGK
jgi:hypothetical protein